MDTLHHSNLMNFFKDIVSVEGYIKCVKKRQFTRTEKITLCSAEVASTVVVLNVLTKNNVLYASDQELTKLPVLYHGDIIE